MKKIFLMCLSLLVFLSFHIFAQQKQQRPQISRIKTVNSFPMTKNFHPFPNPSYNYLLNESFEDNFPPTGWHRISLGNSTQQWVRTEFQKRSGTHSAAVFYCSASETMNEWLITPPLTLSSTVSAKLMFWEDESYWSGYGVGHYVKISTTSQTDVGSFQNLMSMTPNNHTINGFTGNPVEIDLSNYTGQTVYIAFVYVGSDADDWYVDDVIVVEPQAHDIAIDSLSMRSHYAPGTAVVPRGFINNAGLNTESFSVHFGYYDWENNPVILDTKSVSNLASGSTQAVAFNSFVPDTNSEYQYFAATDCSGDMDTSNDTASVWTNTFSRESGNVLTETGTGTWCGFCPGSALAIDSLYKLHPDHLAILEYHNGDDYANNFSAQRINFYRIWGFPTAIFNGFDWRVGGTSATGNWLEVLNSYNEKFQARVHDKTGFSLNLTVTEDNGNFDATALITYVGKSFIKDYKLFFALNESHISENWKGLDSLQFVAREFYPDANGMSIYEGATPPTYGLTQTRSVQFTVPTAYVKENCQLIAFIQNVDNKQVVAVQKADLGNLQSCLLGDVNRDNDITPGDALCAFQIYLNGGQLPAGDCNNPCALEVADVNCTPDGVTPGDALNIFLAYLGGQDPPMDCVPTYQSVSETLALSLSPIQNSDPNLFSVTILVNNPHDIQAFGADIGFPGNLLEFVNAEAGDLTLNWTQVSAHELMDSVIRLGGYHSEAIEQVQPGALLKINFRKKENIEGSGDIFLSNLTDNITGAQTTPLSYSTGGSGVNENIPGKLPEKFDLLPNYPNPFNLETKIRYQVPQTSNVNIQILNMRGQAIRNLVGGQKIAGRHVALWDGRDDRGREAASGIYWCRMKSGKFMKSVKLILMK